MKKITIGKYISRSKNKKAPTWYYKFQRKNYDENGKRKYAFKGGFHTKREAEEAANEEYEIEYSSKQVFVNRRISRMQFESYINEIWFKNCCAMWKSTTAVGYRKMLKNRIIPYFGNYAIGDLSVDILQNSLNEMYLSTSLAVNTIDNVRSLLSQILGYAVKNRHIDYNPMCAVQKPNLRVESATVKNKQVRDAICDDVLNAIFERFPAGTSAFIPAKLCCLAGLRMGEALGLAWCDVDFAKHLIYVRRQLQRRTPNQPLSPLLVKTIAENENLSDFVWYTANPKYESKRTIPMVPELEAILWNEYNLQLERKQNGEYTRYYCTSEANPPYLSVGNGFEAGIVYESNSQFFVGHEIDFVNRHEDGSIVTENTMKHLCRVVHGKDSADGTISNTFNVHSLRHTFASSLRASGISEYVIQSLMGHKSERETRGYMHITSDEWKAVAQQMRGESEANSSLDSESKIKRLFTDNSFTKDDMMALRDYLQSANLG